LKVGFVGYLLCAIAYIVLISIVLIGNRKNSFNQRLAAMSVLQVLWALTMATLLTFVSLPSGTATIAEAIRSFAWIVFLLYLPGSMDTIWRDKQGKATRRHLVLALAVALTLASVLTDYLNLGERWSFGWKVLLSILGLFCVEQIYRNTPSQQRWSVKFLALSMIGLFGFDLVMLSDALLFEALNPNWWAARGFANATLVPLIAIASARIRNMKFEFGLSHNLAFHTATLALAGGYMMVVALAGYLVNLAGGSMAGALQAFLAFSALIALGVLLFASNVRSKIRVFIAKNFFTYQYDYRQEWLNFTDVMSQNAGQAVDSSVIAKRAAQALCRLMEAKSAAVWIRDAENQYAQIVNTELGFPVPETVLNTDPLVVFLQERDWVISSIEYVENRKIYGDAQFPDWVSHSSAILVAPLQLHGELVGFVLLADPRATINLNWEVRDLVKTLGRQTASYLAQQQATRKVVELQQFESFNKMSAFVVHDLKNLVAQLNLLMANAARHKDNPEFQADMLLTVENVLGRMQGLLLQLRLGTKPSEPAIAVDVEKIIRLAVESKGTLTSALQLRLNDAKSLLVKGHADRLSRVIGHLIQNADEACRQKRNQPNQTKDFECTIEIQVAKVDQTAVLTVKDTGVGMDASFVRDKLFRPFNTTKGMGMGIGTFESAEYIREIGGSLKVESEPSVGSVFTISLPLVRSDQVVS
jgi:putative PEP-CTERM system histidine kinase